MLSVTHSTKPRPAPQPSQFTNAAAVVLSLVLCAAVAVPSSPARAQGYAYSDYGYAQPWWKQGNKKPKPQKARVSKRPAGDLPKTAVSVTDKPVEGPLVLVVSLKLQRVTVYDNMNIIATSAISSGRVGNPTPLGVFSVLEKQKMHHSNLYGDAPMPNMQRITWSGVAMHAGVLPGYPASHGCIRLPHGFAQRLYNLTKTGARVIVTRDDAPVQSFSHQTLFIASGYEGAAKTGAAGNGNGAAGNGNGNGNGATGITIGTNGKVADASGRTVAAAPSTGSGIIGVSSAAAATPAGPAPVSPYRQKWLVEMDRRSQALTAAETAKVEAAAKIVSTAQAAEAAKAGLKSARIDADKLTQAIKKNEALRNATEKELDEFAKSLLTERQLTDQQTQDSALREEALDTKLSAITAELTAQADETAKSADRVTAAELLVQTTETERKGALTGVSQAATSLKTALDLVDEAKRREAKRQLPVAIFISRQTKKLYVRQGYAPILETPVDIAEPDKPLGTHVYTALSMAANGHDLNWSVVSVPTYGSAEDRSNDKKRKKDAAKEQPAPQSVSGQTPASALDRIKIPDEAREQIADAMKPGSSLIVSDYGLSNETGVFTDFIIGLR